MENLATRLLRILTGQTKEGVGDERVVVTPQHTGSTSDTHAPASYAAEPASEQKPPEVNIDEIIARSGLIVYDHIPKRGFGLNEMLSRVPHGIDYLGDVLEYTQDHGVGRKMEKYSYPTSAWSDREEENAFIDQHLLEARSIVSLVEFACDKGDKWIQINDFIEAQKMAKPDTYPSMGGYMIQFPFGTVFISHGKLPNNDLYAVSYHLHSSRTDESGRPGANFEYVLLLSKDDCNNLMAVINNSRPSRTHEIFRSIAPEHYDANKNPDEPKGFVCMFPLQRKLY